jgi:TRAP-type transport system periplasmic protein
MKRRTVLAGLGATAVAGALGMPSILRAQAPVTLNGAVQFNDDHAFTKALTRFEELVKKYYGKPVNFTLHKNSSLGLEKQYFEYMSQGKAVDYGIVSPALRVQGHRAHEQGGRGEHPGAGRR